MSSGKGEPRRARTLRSTLLWPTLLTVSVGIVILGVFVERSLHSDLIDRVDGELRRVDQVNRQGPGPERRPRPELPSSSAIGVDLPVQFTMDDGGNILVETSGQNPFSRTEAQSLARSTGFVTMAAPTRYRVLVTNDPSRGPLVTALTLESVDAATSRVRWSFLVGGLVIFCVQCFVLWRTTTAAARPLSNMSRTAQRIADGHLDTPIVTPTGPLETAELGRDLERMVGRLKSMIESSERASAEARATRDNMQRFLADASHEMRTPLTALAGYSDLYRSSMLTEPDQLGRAMGRIGSESRRLSSLVNDMLVLARPVATDPDFGPVDLATVLDDVADDLRAAYPDATIDLEVDSIGELTVLGRRDELHQALLNVGANACRHSDSPHRVIVAARPNGDDIEVRVTDNGPGIDPTVAENVFEPFFRTESSRSRRSGGNGLGLSITRRLIDQHGGTVAVEHHRSPGATFLLTVPSKGADDVTGPDAPGSTRTATSDDARPEVVP